jgi:hypothetical protein
MNWLPVPKPSAATSAKLRARGDLHLDLGIGLLERRDHRLENQWDKRSGNGEAQEPNGPQVTRGFAYSDLLESLCG